MEQYDFRKIEQKWQKNWEESDYGKAHDDSKKPKHYHLVEFPYPSNAGLHVGNCMGYGASDAYCRMKRMQGFETMFPIGWDAFGLPTENFAIRNKVQPAKATANNVAIFKNQMKLMALSFDWSREINTTDLEYYKWTQWIFLQFYKHAIIDSSESSGQVSKLVEVADDDKTSPRLAYQAEMPVNWCPSCKINLANEEVIAGKCERCGASTEKRMQKQWMLRITAYADRLIKDLDNVDFEERIKTQQINWIGKSNGATIRFNLKPQTSNLGSKKKNLFLEVFTTRPDTLFGATFMAISPEHQMLANNEIGITNYEEVKKYIDAAKKKSDLERTELQKNKTGVEIKGIKAINPINNEEIPIFVADYILPNYGTGAVMCVPAHDQRDFEFAEKYDLQIIDVISKDVMVSEAYRPNASEKPKFENNKAYSGPGHLLNSGEFNGLSSVKAKTKITQKLKQLKSGDFAVNYKLRDWIFSRQHYWGEPIPIIHCNRCGIVSLKESDLPLVLPEVENYEPTDTGESPLSKISDWVNVKCPKCGSDAKRETDTMPNWAGSSWYFLRYCDPKSNAELASKEKLDHWMPVDLYNGGMEHTTLHLLYSRFWHKFLYDLGVVPGEEPYQKRIAHGIILGTDGRKMSKSFGNVINPDDMVEKFGADTLRAYIMFIGPYDQESAWNMNGIQGVHRFIKKLWDNFQKDINTSDNDKLELELNKTIKGVSDDIERFSMNTYIAKLMEFNNLLMKEKSIPKTIAERFLILLSPAMPYLAEELWEKLGHNDSIFNLKWPKFDRKIIAQDKLEIPIQINGKVRDRLKVNSDATDDELKDLALKSEAVKKYLAGKETKKIIIVPKKLVSIVI